jgi:hypothetical protein
MIFFISFEIGRNIDWQSEKQAVTTMSCERKRSASVLIVSLNYFV